MIRQRRTIADYIDTARAGISAETSENWALMGVGFKSLDESPSAQKKNRKYICDKNTTSSISSYDCSFAFDVDQIRDETAIAFLVEIGEQQKISDEAETYYVRVDLDSKPSETNNTLHTARKFRVAVEISAFSNDDGDMGCSGNLLPVGDFVNGYFDTSTKTFTENLPTD